MTHFSVGTPEFSPASIIVYLRPLLAPRPSLQHVNVYGMVHGGALATLICSAATSAAAQESPSKRCVLPEGPEEGTMVLLVCRPQPTQRHGLGYGRLTPKLNTATVAEPPLEGGNGQCCIPVRFSLLLLSPCLLQVLLPCRGQVQRSPMAFGDPVFTAPHALSFLPGLSAYRVRQSIILQPPHPIGRSIPDRLHTPPPPIQDPEISSDLLPSPYMGYL